MLADSFAEVMPKGQITLPENVQNALGVSSGDRISFIVEENCVRLMNPAVYALEELQREMRGEAERIDLTSDEDIVALIKEIRHESHD